MTKWISEHALETLYSLVPVFVFLLGLSSVSYVCVVLILRVFDSVTRDFVLGVRCISLDSLRICSQCTSHES